MLISGRCTAASGKALSSMTSVIDITSAADLCFAVVQAVTVAAAELLESAVTQACI